jgi:acyl-ACP thioesterase
MEENAVRTETRAIKSSETDFQQHLKLSAFFEMMQDLASDHADRLGVGYEALQERGLAWVLSRKKVRFFDFPHMGEMITLSTWPRGVQQKLFFMRHHEMTGADGRRLAAAASAYVLVDTQARRVVMPAALDVPMPDNSGLSALDEVLEKIPAEESLQPCGMVQVGYSAVDILGHVNNARYIEWVSDCFSLEEYREFHPAWLQINYNQEVRPGEQISLFRAPRIDNPKIWYITGMNAAGGRKAFEAELGWK